jgi:hypothetical protein
MTESEAIRYPARRAVLGPVAVTSALVVLAMAVTTLPIVKALSTVSVPSIVGVGCVLAWLLLGLTAGYALSGSV